MARYATSCSARLAEVAAVVWEFFAGKRLARAAGGMTEPNCRLSGNLRPAQSHFLVLQGSHELQFSPSSPRTSTTKPSGPRILGSQNSRECLVEQTSL